MKLAEALVLRKHLIGKVAQLEPIKLNGDRGIFEVQVQRRNVNENVDEVTVQTPKLSLADVTAEYDKYAKALRVLEVKIQQTNWAADVDFNEDEMLPPAPKAADPAPTDPTTVQV